MGSPRESSFTRYPLWRKWFGNRSEKAVARYFRRLGFRVIARNLDDRLGEIDLIVCDRRTLIIVEVRSSESRSLQELAATVNRQKQKRLTLAASRFLYRKRKLVGQRTIRFDVVAIRWAPEQHQPEIGHFPNAFEAVGDYQMHF